MTTSQRSIRETGAPIGLLRRIAKRFIPETVRDGLRYLANRGYRRMLRDRQNRAAVERLVAESASQLWTQAGGSVISGPFRGLRYIPESVGSAWAPKLLGTYELELADVIESIVARSPTRIVDIGAAEGYYAVGLAWRISNVRVVAFEAQIAAHSLLKDLAIANRVENRTEVRGQCTAESLNEALGQGADTVVICDVEGAEFQILDPQQVTGLARADVLVEVHPWGHENLMELLRQRFERTHSVQQIHTRQRRITDLPTMIELTPTRAEACMNETRPGPMSWLWMTVLPGGGY